MKHLRLITLFIVTHVSIPLAWTSGTSELDYSSYLGSLGYSDSFSFGPFAQLNSHPGPSPPLSASGDSEPRFDELNEALEQLSLQEHGFKSRTYRQPPPEHGASFFESMVRECILKYAIKGQVSVFGPLMSLQKSIFELGNHDLIMLGSLMIGDPLLKLSSYSVALRKWYCYILFGRTIQGSDNPCGQLNFSEFSILLTEPTEYREEIEWKIAYSVLDDDYIMRQILSLDQTPTLATVDPLPDNLRVKLIGHFLPLFSNEELELWILKIITISDSIQAFGLLLGRCITNLQLDRLTNLTSLMIMQIHHSRLPAAPGFDPDWRCGAYCDFYRAIIRFLPETLSELKGARSVHLPQTAIVQDFPTLSSLFNAKTLWIHDPNYLPAFGFNPDFVRKLDFIALATGFSRSQFEFDSDYKQRIRYISNLIYETVPKHLKNSMPNVWSTTVPWLVANSIYRLLDVFLENWTNGISLRPEIVLQILNLVMNWKADLEPHFRHHPLAIAQLLKYSWRFYPALNTFPPTTLALLQLHASIGRTIEPCMEIGQISTIQFLVPSLIHVVPNWDVAALLRAYLLFQFDIPLQATKITKRHGASLRVDRFASILNVLLTRHCKLQSLQSAFDIKVITSQFP
jgi:hypothetical protein